MKKFFLTVLIVSVAVFSVYSQTGVIRELTGEVELKPAGSSVFVAAQQGSEVAQDTIVSTGFKGTAIIAVGSTTITVRPLTRLSLAEISSSAGTENLNVNLQAGRVRVDVKPPAGTRANTTIQSPSATASVRGTVLEMDTSNLSVIDGRVGWQGKAGPQELVAAGSSGVITSTGLAQQPQLHGGVMPSGPSGSGAAGETIGAASTPTDDGGLDVSVGWGGFDGGVKMEWGDWGVGAP